MEKKFIDGLRVFKPRDNAPEWIQANGVINNKELIAYLQARLNAGEESTRFDVKLSKGGKFYAELNDWKPQQQAQPAQNAPGWPPQQFANQSQEFVPPPTPERQPPVNNSFDIGDIPF